jgi:hypothetical protein
MQNIVTAPFSFTKATEFLYNVIREHDPRERDDILATTLKTRLAAVLEIDIPTTVDIVKTIVKYTHTVAQAHKDGENVQGLVQSLLYACIATFATTRYEHTENALLHAILNDLHAVACTPDLYKKTTVAPGADSNAHARAQTRFYVHPVEGKVVSHMAPIQTAERHEMIAWILESLTERAKADLSGSVHTIKYLTCHIGALRLAIWAKALHTLAAPPEIKAHLDQINRLERPRCFMDRFREKIETFELDNVLVRASMCCFAECPLAMPHTNVTLEDLVTSTLDHTQSQAYIDFAHSYLCHSGEPVRKKPSDAVDRIHEIKKDVVARAVFAHAAIAMAVCITSQCDASVAFIDDAFACAYPYTVTGRTPANNDNLVTTMNVTYIVSIHAGQAYVIHPKNEEKRRSAHFSVWGPLSTPEEVAAFFLKECNLDTQESAIALTSYT